MTKTPFHFDKVLKQMEQVKKDLPPILASQAENYFVGSWKKQGFNNEQWKEVKRREGPGTDQGGEKGTTEWRYPKMYGLARRTNPILVGGGRIKGTAGGALRRAVGNSIRSATFDSVKLIVDLPYAYAINNGDDTIKMPKRQYMGQTSELTEMQQKKVNNFVDKIWLNNK